MTIRPELLAALRVLRTAIEYNQDCMQDLSREEQEDAKAENADLWLAIECFKHLTEPQARLIELERELAELRDGIDKLYKYISQAAPWSSKGID